MIINIISFKFKKILLVSLILFAKLSLANDRALPLKLGDLKGEISIESNKDSLIEEVNNIVIFIEGKNLSSLPTDHRLQKNQETPQITHKGRQFSPRVLPIVRNAKVDFFNDDSIYHNVFSMSKAKPFDLGIYPENTSKLVRFEKTGLVKLYCNIHPKMTSNILVLNNDFYTIPNSNGSFILKNIPLGRYSLRIWHELAEVQELSIEIKEGENTLGKLSLKLTKKYIPHKNKFGKNYRSKY